MTKVTIYYTGWHMPQGAYEVPEDQVAGLMATRCWAKEKPSAVTPHDTVGHQEKVTVDKHRK